MEVDDGQQNKIVSDIQCIRRKVTGFFKKEDVETIKRAVTIGSLIITRASILLRAFILSWYEEKGTLPTVDKDLIGHACEVVQGKVTVQVRTEQDSKKVDAELATDDAKIKNKEVRKNDAQAIINRMLKVYKEDLQGEFVNHKETELNILSSEKMDQAKEKEEADEEVKKQEYKQRLAELKRKDEKKQLREDEADRIKKVKQDKKDAKLKAIEDLKAWSDNKISFYYILQYSIANLVTAYINNIEAHYSKYPKRMIYCDLLKKNPEMKTKEARKIAGIITSYFWCDKDPPPDFNRDLFEYQNLFPEKISDKSRSYDIKVDPWRYLHKMVFIDRSLEDDFKEVKEKYRKLLNPLPFHSSHVPMNIRLDTCGITQLLMTQTRIAEFKGLYDNIHNTNINIHAKSDMNSSYEKIHGHKPASDYEEARYASEVWGFLTNVDTCNQLKELRKNPQINGHEFVFDNAVVTDATAMSIQIVKKEKFRRKKMAPKRKNKEKTDKKEFVESKTDISPPKGKCISNDPGKHDILCMTDGIDTLCYTKGQRQQDCQTRVRTKETNKRRRKAGLEAFETQVMSEFSKSSCKLDTFKQYCRLRFQKEKDFSKLYGHVMFRQFKFLAYCNTKSSEAKFVNKVNTKFKKANQPRKKTKCVTNEMVVNAAKTCSVGDQLIIGWGNWGKNPNALKGCAPTPGIGIRRRFEAYFITRTVDEHYTSQECPCCKERSLEKMKIKPKKLKKKEENATVVPDEIEIHHLLRCTNDKCKCRLWNRNVVGSYNILSRFLTSPMPLENDGNEVNQHIVLEEASTSGAG